MHTNLFSTCIAASTFGLSLAVPVSVADASNALPAVPPNATLPLNNPGYTYVEYFEGSYPKGQKPTSLDGYNLTKVTVFSQAPVVQRANAVSCPVRVTRSYAVKDHGNWFTAWCHQSGATLYPGGQAGITQAKSTTVQFSAEASLAGALSEAIDASIGLTIQISKSAGVYEGCTNNHDYLTTVWWQEKMGWVNTQITTDIEDCDGAVTNTEIVHADFPDPDNTGFREFIPGCGSTPSTDGPFCDFNADHL